MCKQELSEPTTPTTAADSDSNTDDSEQSSPQPQRRSRPSLGGGQHITDRRFEAEFTVQRKVLGSGFNGEVKVVTGKDGRTHALKCFKKSRMAQNDLDDLRQEIDVHLPLDHPHIVRLEWAFESDDEVHLILEHLKGGELYNFLSLMGVLREDDAANVVRQVVLAVAYLHAHGVVHRDLKLENIVYEDKKRRSVKIIDFGFATHWDGCTPLTQKCGTPLYAAPEFVDMMYNNQVDMWALGVLTHEMLLLGSPFPKSQATDKTDQRKPCYGAGFRKNISANAQDFIRSLLTPDPADRLTARDALLHPWLQCAAKSDGTTRAPERSTLRHLRDFAEIPRFRRACLAAMIPSLPADTHARLRVQFNAMDNDRDGVITFPELHEYMAGLGLQHEQTAELFQHLDTNGDDEISYNEFLAAMLQGCTLEEKECRIAFHRFDTDNSGLITATNLQSALEGSAYGTSMQDLIKEADRSGDGTVNMEEFLTYLKPGTRGKRAMKSHTTPGLLACFQYFNAVCS